MKAQVQAAWAFSLATRCPGEWAWECARRYAFSSVGRPRCFDSHSAASRICSVGSVVPVAASDLSFRSGINHKRTGRASACSPTIVGLIGILASCVNAKARRPLIHTRVDLNKHHTGNAEASTVLESDLSARLAVQSK